MYNNGNGDRFGKGEQPDHATHFLIVLSMVVMLLIGTLYGKNLISYTQSAGNLSLYLSKSNTQSASETTRETSFNFSAFRQYYKTIHGNDTSHICNN